MALVVNAGEMICQMALPCVVPALVETTCRLALPECLMVVLKTEPVRLAETVHGPGKAGFKIAVGQNVRPASGTLPATSLMSST